MNAGRCCSLRKIDEARKRQPFRASEAPHQFACANQRGSAFQFGSEQMPRFNFGIGVYGSIPALHLSFDILQFCGAKS